MIVDKDTPMVPKLRRSQAVRTLADLANLVGSARRARGLTQAQLATKARVSRAWLAAVEGGKPRVDFSLILRTLAALDIHLTATTGERAKTTPRQWSTAVTPADIDGILRRASTGGS